MRLLEPVFHAPPSGATGLYKAFRIGLVPRHLRALASSDLRVDDDWTLLHYLAWPSAFAQLLSHAARLESCLELMWQGGWLPENSSQQDAAMLRKSFPNLIRRIRAPCNTAPAQCTPLNNGGLLER
eukprot:742276-Amphidinium_carterae.1